MQVQPVDFTNAYTATTHDITVRVVPQYLEDESSPQADRYVWAYHVEIENGGKQLVRLKSRYWQITDSNGTVHEVSGEGVVGEQPLLEPGERFRYTSGTPLATPSGMMMGNYKMETETGERLQVEVPAFSLDTPMLRPAIN